MPIDNLGKRQNVVDMRPAPQRPSGCILYGALSNAMGEVHLSWMVDHTSRPSLLVLRWQEKGGPAVEPPTRKGFGSRLIERSLAHDLDGDVRIEYAPAGLVCSVETPLPP